ncbi:MAG: thioredoxin-dependent thiol peroxidase [Bacteroidales bacterium]|jgi:peroxiredoxin Q/BCP|nr:thioredoxin-dependent thiol peroxidase [Bacteroidales bacterium]
MKILKTGELAPDFKGVDQDEKSISLKDFKGNKVIIYFYPKDDTPGCTAEACNLRDNYNDWINKGFIVIGISPDSIASHKKFAEKYNLPFSLISDPDKEILQAYNAWGEKKMYGKVYQGVLRKTFILDKNHKIEKIIEKVDTKDHTNQIFKELKL